MLFIDFFYHNKIWFRNLDLLHNILKVNFLLKFFGLFSFQKIYLIKVLTIYKKSTTIKFPSLLGEGLGVRS